MSSRKTSRSVVMRGTVKVLHVVSEADVTSVTIVPRAESQSRLEGHEVQPWGGSEETSLSETTRLPGSACTAFDSVTAPYGRYAVY